MEVTLLLTVASAALVIPYERLRPRSREQHHIAEASDRSPEAVRMLAEFEQQSCTEVFPGDSWRIIPRILRDAVIRSQVDEWAHSAAQERLPTDYKVSELLRVIRNALAHGALFIHPILERTGTRPSIGQLLFVSEIWEKNDKGKFEPTDRYNVILVSPADFQAMLLKWLEFLDTLPVIPQFVSGDIGEVDSAPAWQAVF